MSPAEFLTIGIAAVMAILVIGRVLFAVGAMKGEILARLDILEQRFDDIEHALLRNGLIFRSKPRPEDRGTPPR